MTIILYVAENKQLSALIVNFIYVAISGVFFNYALLINFQIKESFKCCCTFKSNQLFNIICAQNTP